MTRSSRSTPDNAAGGAGAGATAGTGAGAVGGGLAPGALDGTACLTGTTGIAACWDGAGDDDPALRRPGPRCTGTAIVGASTVRVGSPGPVVSSGSRSAPVPCLSTNPGTRPIDSVGAAPRASTPSGTATAAAMTKPAT